MQNKTMKYTSNMWYQFKYFPFSKYKYIQTNELEGQNCVMMLNKR